MPIKETVYYAIVCDHGECGRNATEEAHDEYDVQATVDMAAEDARDAEWQRVEMGRATRWYCPDHFVDVAQPEGEIHDPTPPPAPLFDLMESGKS